MRIKTLSILLPLSLCFLTIHSQAQSYTWQSLTPEHAAQMAQRFEDDPNLPLTLSESGIPPRSFNTATRQRFTLQTEARVYGFDLRTTDFFAFYDKSDLHPQTFYGQPFDTNVLAPQAMSQTAAEKIARDYMKAHYPDPDWFNTVDVSFHSQSGDEPTDAVFIVYYDFRFHQDINGVRGPAECDIRVDTIFGRILHFYGIHYPTLISTAPRLSVDQAYACYFNTQRINGKPSGKPKLFVEYPDGMGNQRLQYGLEYFAGNQRCEAIVDANDGTTIDVIQFHGGGTMPTAPVSKAILEWQAKLARRPAVAKTVLTPLMGEAKAEINYPPLLVDGQPYLYVGYLCYGAKDVKLRYNGRDDIAIVSPERAARFSLHKAEYTLNGKTRALPAKPVIVEDRCYVPLQAAQDTMPFRIAYDAAKKQVRFDALPAAKTAGANASKEEVVFGGKR